MESLKKTILRDNRTWTDNILLTYLLAYIWMSIGVVISILLGCEYWGKLFSADEDVITFMGRIHIRYPDI